MNISQLEEYVDTVADAFGVSEKARLPFSLGFLQQAVVTAMSKMTEEEQTKFFPGLKVL